MCRCFSSCCLCYATTLGLLTTTAKRQARVKMVSEASSHRSRFFFFRVYLMPAINARIHRYVSLAVYLCHLKYEKRLKVGRNMQDDDGRRANRASLRRENYISDVIKNWILFQFLIFARESCALLCELSLKTLNSTIPFFMCLAASSARSWVAIMLSHSADISKNWVRSLDYFGAGKRFCSPMHTNESILWINYTILTVQSEFHKFISRLEMA